MTKTRIKGGAVGGVSGQTRKEGTSPNISYKISQGLTIRNRHLDSKAEVSHELTLEFQRRPVGSGIGSSCRRHLRLRLQQQM